MSHSPPSSNSDPSTDQIIQRLERANKSYKNLTQNIPGVVFQIVQSANAEDRFIYISKGCKELLGHPPKDFIEDYALLERLIHPDDIFEMHTLQATFAFANKPLRWTGRILVDKREKWIKIDTRPNTEMEGEVVWDGVITDLSHEKEIEAELRDAKEIAEKANRTQTEFLGIAAHDMKNPLAGISGLAQYLINELKTGNVDIEDLLDTLDMICGASDNMLAIINNLLNTQHIEDPHFLLKKGSTNLANVVREAIQLNQFIADKKGIAIEAHISPSVKGFVDPIRMREAMDNLVNNAIKYASPPSRIDIYLERKEDRACFRVSDEGPGLKAEDFDHVFGKFKKLSARPTGKETSTGLGLSIVKRLIELHDGHVFVTNNKDKGATFGFEIPLEKRS